MMFENETKLLDLAKQLNVPYANLAIVGSTMICGKGGDLDVLCLMANELGTFDTLEREGFKPDITDAYDSEFQSYRKCELNLLVTHNVNYFIAELTAAVSAHIIFESGHLDMSQREVRVTFHSLARQIMYPRLGVTVPIVEPAPVPTDNHTGPSNSLAKYRHAGDLNAPMPSINPSQRGFEPK